jgi:alcohol dehydrogenase (cytochrome c)
VLVDGVINGEKRKLLVQASRNGYYFVFDRTNGKNLLTVPFIDKMNWVKEVNAKGQPIPDPAKEPKPDGVLVMPSTEGATNWQPVSLSPETGLLYVGSNPVWSMFYLTDTDDHPQGWAGLDRRVGPDRAALLAIDYQTGKIVWRHDWPGSGGPTHMLTTAGKLLFTSNGNNLIAFDPADGKTLWHTRLAAAPSGGLITYLLDGRQYLLAPAGDMLYAFTVNEPVK